VIFGFMENKKILRKKKISKKEVENFREIFVRLMKDPDAMR
jgi:hypothetical protein